MLGCRGRRVGVEGLGRVRRRVGADLAGFAGGDAVRGLPHAAAGRLPRLAAVARALDNLSKPPARLRRVQPVGVGRRALHVIDLPAGEVRAADVPPPALAVRREAEASLTRADQYPYTSHA